MAIKRKDFQKLADSVNDFQKKLTEGKECAELRDALNLTLFLMQKHYRYLQLKMRNQTKQKSVIPSQNALGQFTNNLKVSDDNKFEWTWVSGDSPRMIESLPLAKQGLQVPVPLIVQAARDGDLNMIRQLVERDPNCVNDIDSYGRTALFYCIHYGQINTMAVLLQCGANPEVSCNEGSLPLHIACFYGNAAAADLLLHNQQPDSINFQDSYGRSAVHWATIPSTTDCLRLLIRYGAILNLRDGQGLSPAMWACRKDRLQHLQLLLQVGLSTSEPDGIERDEQGLTWLHWAVIGGTECFIALMDETTVQLRDKSGRTAFLFAAEKGCIDALKVMRDRVPRDRLFDVDRTGRTALHLATLNGQGRIAGFLLDCGLSPEDRDNGGQTAMDLARGRQLNYCLRVFAAHLTTTAQPNYRSSAKGPFGGISSSPFGTLGDPSPSPSVERGSAHPAPPQHIRPPMSETPHLIPRPPPHPNRANVANDGGRLIQSTDQMDATPITTLHPTPPPRNGRRNVRMNRQRHAETANAADQDMHPNSGNENQAHLLQTYPQQRQNDNNNSMIVDQPLSDHVVPVHLVQDRTDLQPRPESQEHQVAVEQYNAVEYMQPSEGDDVTVGVAPLTVEALAYQQQELLRQQQQFYVSKDHNMGAAKGHSDNQAAKAASIITKQNSIHDEADENGSVKSITAERADDDDTCSSHDSTADTVVHSPSKQSHRHHGHHQILHDQRPPHMGQGFTPRPFLSSAKTHTPSPLREDSRDDDSTPPPSKIPILSAPKTHQNHHQQHMYAQQALWNQGAGYPVQKGHQQIPENGFDGYQPPFQQSPLQAQHLGTQHNTVTPWAPLPPVVVHHPPPNKIIPPSMPDVFGLEGSPSAGSKKQRKSKKKASQLHQQQQFITPLQPIYSLNSSPVVSTPPPPQTSPSALVPAHRSMQPDHLNQEYAHQTLCRIDSRTVETEHMDHMEAESMDIGAGHPDSGTISPLSPLMSHQNQHSNRPPSRREQASNEERERAMYANNNANYTEPQHFGTPTILSRRSRQNAPVLSPSPTGTASPKIRHKEKTRSVSPNDMADIPYQNPRARPSGSLPNPNRQSTPTKHRSSPVISLSSSPIPVLTTNNKSGRNSDNEAVSRPTSSEIPGSPPPSVTLPSAIPGRPSSKRKK